MKSTPENKVKLIIRKYLDTLPNCYYFMPASNGFGRAGIPDFIGHVGGKFFAIEAKTEGGKVTALQTRELLNISSAGGVAIVVRGVDEAQLLNLMEHIKC